MNRLRPRTTAGAPGSVAPMISKSPPDTCARYQVDGTCALRCGSLASSGLPDAVNVPSTTQLFEPSASADAPPRRMRLISGSPPASDDTRETEDSGDTNGTNGAEAARRAVKPSESTGVE